ncbi:MULTISPECIES: (2Fe-2S)-binding protein [unclassified Rhizobium]|uniref:(2Fe-2S)-binding protein n=1 Tax=Rhizobium sp. PP-CC-3G-465 TaxID=2135648 RepID=UPI00104724BD|nr:carbon-monoxide dehydrogenase small subunit [Rhizobium sp. PP-CC-2G-626]TCQ23472.1 carbon-monoxide dehydrogenase small subunit [Rhizobium sp. PP-CC-3G-465]
MSAIAFRLNGEMQSIVTPAETRLSEILRDQYLQTATKVACGIGRCGACTVMMNGQAVNACLVMAWQIEGADIVSPEGLDAFETARIVKAALIDENAFQCGYCAPGFLMALTVLFLSNRQAGEPEILSALEGNLCRCTGYHSILRGALSAANRLRSGAASETGDTP